ncbi:M56 family metallopeptidase [Mongoliitalea daihaiensis]|uniref:M56 family metallopeptidase n=1 Tax=Mongoliitalea daihaiensis TaxID=2782006 RepID=UPI001F280AEB|nr:M56 family metallopeptidase [Mongoliitalea daihaiensis]UJP64689.1 TonB family protein [Mongoliitalea daihaiensis]
MNQLANYLWEASVALFILYGFYHLFLAKLTFFTWNRAYLLTGLVFVISLPLMQFSIGPAQGLMPDLFEYTLPTIQVGVESVQPNSLSFAQILLLVYVMGVCWKLGVLGVGLKQLIHHIQRGTHMKQDGLTLVVHPDFQPASFFSYIFLPHSDTEDVAMQPIIHHETVHARKRHTLDLLFFQLVQAFLWFHPVCRYYEASIREVHEYEADQVVTTNFSKSAYARLLLNLLIRESHGSLVNNFNHFQTKKRIQMMMKSEQSHALQKSVFLLAIPLMAAILLVFACDSKKEETTEIIEVVDVPIAEADTPDVFDMVEEAPEFAGGMEALNAFLAANLKYPQQAKEMGIEGTVYVMFEIHPDGKVKNEELLRGIGGGCDEEALRVVKMLPDWIPGKQGGEEVAVRMRLPVKFKLS